jgi:hypothetical protein
MTDADRREKDGRLGPRRGRILPQTTDVKDDDAGISWSKCAYRKSTHFDTPNQVLPCCTSGEVGRIGTFSTTLIMTLDNV